jgi:small-conductance mechanosensitive channel
MIGQTWPDVLISSFQNLWGGVLAFLPQLIVALIVFVTGLMIAVALGKVVEQIVKSLKVDVALKSLGIEEPLSRAGWKLDSGAFIGGLVRWFFILVFVLAAADVLKLAQVTEFLSSIVLIYIPQVIAASLILVAAALLAEVVRHLVEGSAKAAHLPSAGFLGGVAKWAIWIFALMAALYQLGIAGPLVQTLFTAFVAMVALAGGLAFGLGGKETAARYLERLREDITNR